MGITVEVFSMNPDVYEPLTYEGTLASVSGQEFLDDLNETGAWSFEIKAGHADEDLLQDERLVRFKVDGEPRFWGLIEAPSEKVQADPDNREAGRVVKFKGRGASAMMEDAAIFPVLGLGRVSPDSRIFAWPSTAFDDTAWDDAVALKQVNDDTEPWSGAPQDWRDHDNASVWVGPVDGDVPGEPVPGGFVLFRDTFTIGSGDGGEYVIDVTADDGFVIYIDDEKIGEEQGAGMWGVTRATQPFMLDEGDHQIAVKLLNFDRPNNATNVMGMPLTMFRMGGGGAVLSDVVFRLTAASKMLAFPDHEPGFTPGKLVADLHEEALSRGCLLNVSYVFDADVDSLGASWVDDPDLLFPVGTSYLDVLRRLAEEGACDFTINPSTVATLADEYIELQLLTEMGDDLSDTVVLQYATNIAAEQVEHVPAGKDTLLARTAEGRYLQRQHVSAGTGRRRKEGGYSLGTAPSDGAAYRQMDAELDKQAVPVEVITSIQIEVKYLADGSVDTSDPEFPVPFVHFNKGDTVSATSYDGTLASFLVTGVHVTVDAAGVPIYRLDLERADDTPGS
jgi:hypothetical protein